MNHNIVSAPLLEIIVVYNVGVIAILGSHHFFCGDTGLHHWPMPFYSHNIGWSENVSLRGESVCTQPTPTPGCGTPEE
jgi:hypothetical protein